MAQSDHLQCDVVCMQYNFDTQEGIVRLRDGDCCDMIGCITMFEKIDPEVSRISTYSGEEADTEYQKRGNVWCAYPPGGL